jgi:hypothetical protein
MINVSEVPILVTGFNRPNLLDNVLESLSLLGQQNIWVALDGPRPGLNDDKISTRACLDILLKSPVYTKERSLIRTVNAGCKYGMAEAITWFFQNNEMGIVIEDDLTFERDFLEFCLWNLERYQFDNSVGSITGFMPVVVSPNQNGTIGTSVSHKYFSAWGWASWANRWSKYDVELRNWRGQLSPFQIYMKFALENPRYWIRRFDDLESGLIDTWDFQFLFTHFSNNWKVIAPNRNLIGNLGFGDDATHTKSKRKVPQISRLLPEELKYSHFEVPRLNRKSIKEYLRIQFGF